MNIKVLKDLKLEEIHLEAGSVMIQEKKPGRKVFVLIKGKVRISSGDHEITVTDAPGTVFGEIAALLGTDSVATVTTVEASTFYLIEQFRDFLLENPEAALSVAQILACRVINMNNHFVQMKDELQKMQGNLQNYLPVFPENFQP